MFQAILLMNLTSSRIKSLEVYVPTLNVDSTNTKAGIYHPLPRMELIK